MPGALPLAPGPPVGYGVPMPCSEAAAARPGTQSVQRALGLVRLVAGQGQRGMRIKELTALSGLSATTVFRMVHGLIDEGVIERDPRTRKLYLGHLVHELGLAARQTTLRGLCHDALRQLGGIVRETRGVVYLSDRSGTEAVCVDRAVDPVLDPGWPLDVGLRCPLGVGVGGLAILSALPADTADRMVLDNAPRYDRQPGLGAARLLRELAASRRRGHARRDSVMVPGVVAIGLPVPYGASTGSLTVACMKDQLDRRRTERVLQALADARERIGAPQSSGGVGARSMSVR